MKLFKTLRDVPCFMGHEFRKLDRHYLFGDLEYETTNASYCEYGHFYFELHDENGYIGTYIITKDNLDLIEPL